MKHRLETAAVNMREQRARWKCSCGHEQELVSSWHNRRDAGREIDLAFEAHRAGEGER